MDIKQRLAELRAKKAAENNNAQDQKIEVSQTQLHTPEIEATSGLVETNAIATVNSNDVETQQTTISQSSEIKPAVSNTVEAELALTNNQASEIAGDNAVAKAIAKSQENNHAQETNTAPKNPEVQYNNSQVLGTRAEETNSFAPAQSQVETKPSTAVSTIGTNKTSEIDHLAFMSNLQELSEAIIHQHPRMPVLLMTIHKHLRTDPELVTTLSEEEIGVIVNGLKIQTKTELTGTVLKQSKAKAKKTVLSTDMF